MAEDSGGIGKNNCTIVLLKSCFICLIVEILSKNFFAFVFESKVMDMQPITQDTD